MPGIPGSNRQSLGEIAPRVVDIRVLAADTQAAAVVIVERAGREVERAIAAG